MAAEGFANKDGVWSLQNEATKERTAQARLPPGAPHMLESLDMREAALQCITCTAGQPCPASELCARAAGAARAC